MRSNLTKKEIINSIYMQLGFSRKVVENLLEDIFALILDELILNNKVKIPKFQSLGHLKLNLRKKEKVEIPKQKKLQ